MTLTRLVDALAGFLAGALPTQLQSRNDPTSFARVLEAQVASDEPPPEQPFAPVAAVAVDDSSEDRPATGWNTVNIDILAADPDPAPPSAPVERAVATVADPAGVNTNALDVRVTPNTTGAGDGTAGRRGVRPLESAAPSPNARVAIPIRPAPAAVAVTDSPPDGEAAPARTGFGAMERDPIPGFPPAAGPELPPADVAGAEVEGTPVSNEWESVPGDAGREGRALPSSGDPDDADGPTTDGEPGPASSNSALPNPAASAESQRSAADPVLRPESMAPSTTDEPPPPSPVDVPTARDTPRDAAVAHPRRPEGSPVPTTAAPGAPAHRPPAGVELTAPAPGHRSPGPDAPLEHARGSTLVQATPVNPVNPVDRRTTEATDLPVSPEPATRDPGSPVRTGHREVVRAIPAIRVKDLTPDSPRATEASPVPVGDRPPGRPGFNAVAPPVRGAHQPVTQPPPPVGERGRDTLAGRAREAERRPRPDAGPRTLDGDTTTASPPAPAAMPADRPAASVPDRVGAAPRVPGPAPATVRESPVTTESVTLSIPTDGDRVMRVHVSVRGFQVMARIVPPDATAAAQLVRQRHELHSALAERGFESTIAVRSGAAGVAGDWSSHSADSTTPDARDRFGDHPDQGSGRHARHDHDGRRDDPRRRPLPNLPFELLAERTP